MQIIAAFLAAATLALGVVALPAAETATKTPDVGPGIVAMDANKNPDVGPGIVAMDANKNPDVGPGIVAMDANVPLRTIGGL